MSFQPSLFTQNKYSGSSYDGFADSSSILLNLNGTGSQLPSKFFGGSFDGYGNSVSPLSNLGGTGSQILAKYFGGSFDGFSDSSSVLSNLNGNGSQLSAKYNGGSFDGFSDNVSILSQLGGGGSITSAKYNGGSFDGFADSSSPLSPLNGLVITIRLTTLLEGFYNSAANSMIKDTITVYLRSASPAPFQIIDSATVYLSSTGRANVIFHNAQSSLYYLVVKHRNSIETWSKTGGENLISGTSYNFDFTASQTQAYGSNLVLSGTKWCIYSGDSNQDGVIDGTDLSLIDNDASNFTSGYTNSDVNGDQVVDGSDLSIVDNNASNFISVQKPPGAPGIIQKSNKFIQDVKRKPKKK